MIQARDFYSGWLGCQYGAVFWESSGVPSEKMLQAIWQNQRLRSGSLKTTDGQSLRILHPGFKNHEAGPDFCGALIRLGDAPPQTGDIELDLIPSGWRSHGHHSNPDFKNVILQVVWKSEGSASGAGFPTLAVHDVLDMPLAELALWFGGVCNTELPQKWRGHCSSSLKELGAESIAELLQQAALVRLAGKASGLKARAGSVGWVQTLWEGLFRALGFKQNVWPMQRLAELKADLLSGKPSVLELQARLLGVSGLLPEQLLHRELTADSYLRQVWDAWWRERDRFSDLLLPRSAWRLNSTRPANHPQRRLALAAHWLANQDFLASLEKWGLNISQESADSLFKVLMVTDDPFWSRHWTFHSAPMKSSQPLLGSARVTDIAVNVIFPWLWSRAMQSGKEVFRSRIEQAYLTWPAGQDSARLKLARQRLLGGSLGGSLLKTSAMQQGLLQIVQDYCSHTNAVCDHCGFPELVRAWSASHGLPARKEKKPSGELGF